MTCPSNQYFFVYDDQCGLCHRTISMLANRDDDHLLRFVPNQSPLGEKLLSAYAEDSDHQDRILLVIGDEVFEKSDAYLKLARDLSFAWGVRHILAIIPKRLRDWGYDVIGRHRYRFFGRVDCDAGADQPRIVTQRIVTEVSQYES